MPDNWGSLDDLIVLQDRMNRLFEDATQKRVRNEASASDQFERADWTPASDVHESEASYVIFMDLPGVDRSALAVDVDGSRLVVSGNRALETPSGFRSERPRGKFLRTFLVPAGIDQSKISAQYRDGVLEITLPKRNEQKTQRVDIKIS
jgi:HSP20 family protein